MLELHHILVRPLLEASSARRLLEIGSDQAGHSRLLAEYARDTGGHVDIIEPTVSDALADVRDDFADVVTVHVGKSLDVLERLAVPDAALIDGDHNYYTVQREIQALYSAARTASRPLPLLLFHDVGWPYGRRDMYYDPRDVPDTDRNLHARRGIKFGESELAPVGGGGFNQAFENAVHEGGERNGVFTAVEDAANVDDQLTLHRFHGMHGLAVLAHRDLLAQRPQLADFLALASDPTVEALTRTIEEARCMLLQQMMDQAWRAAQAEAEVDRLRTAPPTPPDNPVGTPIQPKEPDPAGAATQRLLRRLRR